MSSLKFPADWYCPEACGGQHYEFCRVDKYDGRPLDLVAKVSKRLHNKGNSQVFRANLTSGDDDINLDVVLKLVYGNRAIRRLRQEADYYCHELKEAQGQYVPRFRGLYEGETDEGLTACLVLDYCGHPLRTEIWAMKSVKKHSVVSALLAVHLSGLRHCDFSEHNVVMDDNGKAFIVDFDHAERHNCEVRLPIAVNSKEPLQQQFNCDELYWMCKFGQVWTPRLVQFIDRTVPVEWADSLELLMSKAPPGMDPRIAFEHAADTINELCDYEDGRREIERRKE